jgi:polyphosphate kinase
LYLSRELSWIDFNHRVLQEARNPRWLLLERVKFAAIFGSNLDEFLMVRVSGVLEQIAQGVVERGHDGRTPAEELAAIRAALVPQIAEHERLVADELLPALADQGIQVVDYAQTSRAEREALRTYFEQQVFPVCTPLAVDPRHPFPLISNLSLNLAVLLEDPDAGQRFARVKVPNVLPRLVAIPRATNGQANGAQRFVWLEQVLTAHLDRLFPGLRVRETHPFRVIRDAEIEIQEIDAGDLLETMESGINRRRFNSVAALQIHSSMTEQVRALLVEHLRVDDGRLWVVDGPLGLSDLMELTHLDRPELKDRPFQPHVPAALRDPHTIFTAIRQGDVLLNLPFDSFKPIVDLVQQAAADPAVLAVKQTLYRVGKQSPIVQALQTAVEDGKQVAAVVELKARFDEENNIEWARRLEQAGAHVSFGVPELKTHAKLALVVRREADGLRRYVHVGTGNYNPATARLYTDLGIFTANEDVAADVSDVFNHLTGYSRQTKYRRLLVAPVNLRQGLRERIEREIEHHGHHGKGRLIFKMNALVDHKLIHLLYKASKAGVKVDLLVRGICCLRPGVPGVSEHIRVVSVIGRFLEHSRIYYFRNGDRPEILIGSADLMPRNLDHRVEVLAPVESEDIARYIHDEILETYLKDNVQAWELHSDGVWRRRRPERGEVTHDAQATLLARALAHHEDTPVGKVESARGERHK